MGSKDLENKLKEKGYDIPCKDIQYKEGILEYLELNNNIDYIIVNENLEGEIEIEELKKEIKNINNKINIILISDKDFNEEKLFKNLNSDNYEEKIINSKNKINSNNYEENKIKRENSIFNQKTLPLNNLFENEHQKNNNKEIICVVGPNGVGKSVFSILFAQNVKNRKSIIIDFDIFNTTLQTILGVKDYEEKIKKGIKENNLISHKIDINKYIIKTKRNIDLLSGINLIFDENYKLSYKKIGQIIEILEEQYDLIIFDTSTESLLDYTRELMNEINKIIFISGANLLEIKKSQTLLNIYTNEWDINKRKINIVFNKCSNKSVDESILREIFNQYNILGKISLSEYYDLIVNKNMSQKNKLNREIEKIKKQIIKEKYHGAFN